MITNAIKKWLDNPLREFKAGKELYNIVKKDKQYDDFFANDNPPRESVQFKLLLKELGNYYRICLSNPKYAAAFKLPESISAAKQPEKAISVTKFSQTKSISSKNTKASPDDPQFIKDLYLDNAKIRDEIKSLHAKMRLQSISDEERKKLADQICDLEEKSNANFAKIDGYTPDQDNSKAPVPGNVDPLELTKKINAARKYISENKNTSDPKKAKKVKEYEDFLIEIKVSLPNTQKK